MLVRLALWVVTQSEREFMEITQIYFVLKFKQDNFVSALF